MTDVSTTPANDRTGDEKPENLIEIRGLLSQFGEQVIHKDLDLDVVRGEVLGVVGGSGTKQCRVRRGGGAVQKFRSH